MHVVIVGGGIAGLTAARELSSSSVRVTLVEASDYLGGRIRADKDFVPRSRAGSRSGIHSRKGNALD